MRNPAPSRYSRARHAPARALQPGFTLAELIVAIVLLTMGLGALAGTTAWILLDNAASRRTERAARLAHDRLERLRLAGCAPGGAARVHGDLIERWSLSVDARHATAVVTIGPRDSARMPEQRYRAVFPC